MLCRKLAVLAVFASCCVSPPVTFGADADDVLVVRPGDLELSKQLAAKLADRRAALDAAVPVQPATPPRPPLTDDSLKSLMEGLGYECKPIKLDNGRTGQLIAVQRGTWLINLRAALSGDGAYLWLTTNLCIAPEPDKLAGPVLLDLLTENGNIGPNHFAFRSKSKLLTLERPERNGNLSPALVGQCLSELCDDTIALYPKWNKLKETAPAPVELKP